MESLDMISDEMFAVADAMGHNLRQAQRDGWAWRHHAENLESINATLQGDKARLEGALKQRDKRIADLERQLRETQTARAVADGQSRTLAETSAAMATARRELESLRADLDACGRQRDAYRSIINEQTAQCWYVNKAYLTLVDHAQALEDKVLLLGGEVTPLPEFAHADEALTQYKVTTDCAIAKRLRTLDGFMTTWRQQTIARNEVTVQKGGGATPIEPLKATNVELAGRLDKAERQLAKTDEARRLAVAYYRFYKQSYNSLYEYGMMFEDRARTAGFPIPEEFPAEPDVAAIFVECDLPIEKAAPCFKDEADYAAAKARYSELLAAKLAAPSPDTAPAP